MLYEYAGDNPVKGYSNNQYTVMVKADGGEQLKLRAGNQSDRLILIGDDSVQLHTLMLKNRTIKFHIVEDDSPTTQYDFSVDATGYTVTYNKL